MRGTLRYFYIYENWNVDVDLDGDNTLDYPWDFRTVQDYPKLKADRDGDEVKTRQEAGAETRTGDYDLGEGTMPAGVELRVSPGALAEDGGAQQATVTAVLRDASGSYGAGFAPGHGLTFPLTLSGDNANDYTYAPVQPSITIGPWWNRGSTTITITPLNDGLGERDEPIFIEGAATIRRWYPHNDGTGHGSMGTYTLSHRRRPSLSGDVTASGTGRWKASRPGKIRLVAGESPGRALTYQWEQIAGPQLAGTVMNGAEPRTVEIYQQQEDGSFVTYTRRTRGIIPGRSRKAPTRWTFPSTVWKTMAHRPANTSSG